jgi:hypothetical protein
MTPYAAQIASASKQVPTTFNAYQSFTTAAAMLTAPNQPIAPLASVSQIDPIDHTQTPPMFPSYFKYLKKK